MRVRMKTTKYVQNGIQPFCYMMGQSYFLPDSLAKEYLSRGWCIEDKVIEVKETKTKKRRKKKVV